MLYSSLKNKSAKMILMYIVGYLFSTLLKSSLCIFPFRSFLLRLLGSKIDKGSRLYEISFWNFYKNGFKNLRIGEKVFIGPETMIDLADKVTIGTNSTVSARVIILTHVNVGFDDNPLKIVLPDNYSSVNIGDRVFIGVNSTIMPGVTIGNDCIIGAMSIVLKDVASGTIVAGVPAKVIGKTNERI